PARGEGEQRIGEADVPAGIAARIFVIGGKHRAAPVIQRVEIALHRALIGYAALRARDGDAAAGHETLFQTAHQAYSQLLPPARTGRRPDNKKGRPTSAAASFSTIRSPGRTHASTAAKMRSATSPCSGSSSS